MIRDIVNQVVLNIAKQYPIITDNRAINMYAFIEESNVLTAQTFDKIYVDYLQGKLWCRNWEQEGADPNTLRREYPFISLENVSISKDDPRSSCECYEFWIMIGDQVQPRDCPQRSEVDVVSSLYKIASNVLKELFSVHKYVNGGDVIFASKKYVEYYQDKGELLGYRKTTQLLSDNQEPISIRATELGNGDNVRAVSFRFTVCGSYTPITYNYESAEASKMTHSTICDIC